MTRSRTAGSSCDGSITAVGNSCRCNHGTVECGQDTAISGTA